MGAESSDKCKKRSAMNKCIIIPAYNEEILINRIIKNIRKKISADIIVIDDGSEDQTSLEAEMAGAYVIKHPFNLGYGIALQTGYKYALQKGYDYLAQMDGDGQHNPTDIPLLFKELENGDCDIVIGSRFLTGNFEIGFLKKTAIALFSKIILILTGEKISDPTSGFQAMNARVLRFFSKDFPYDYPDANIIILMHRMGFTVKEIPVSMYPNPEGRSMHAGLFKVSHYFFKVFLSIFITMLRKRG